MENGTFGFAGKTALVTGSTQGIGYAVAKGLAAAGAEVWVHCSRDIAKAERVAKEIGAAHACVADLADAQETAALFGKTGAVDILICNASVQFKEKWEDVTPAHFETQVNVNFRSTLQLMQAYYPAMKEKRAGRIITVGSVNQYRRHEELPIYAATKCAVMSLVQNAAKYAAPYGVTVNNVSPGAIRTPRNAAVWEDAALRQKVNASIPVGRFGEADEVAQSILFLCTDEAAYITGADLSIDGGMKL